LVGPLAGGNPQNGGKVWRLAASSNTSFKHSGFLLVNPEMKIEPASKETAAYAFGYAYQGPLKSAFVTAPAASVSVATDQPLSESKKPVRIVVLGNAAFANDEWTQLARYLPIYAAGAQLIYNAIGWTVEDEALIPLRSKTMDSRQITPTSDAKASVVQWTNVLGLPVAFCLFGIARWRLRKLNRTNQKL
jgi:hypothetical protein